jgi:GNAT superfamily N-acetyltransferase
LRLESLTRTWNSRSVQRTSPGYAREYERSRRGVGIARYNVTATGVADVAVDPACRRIGLATALVERLAQAALARGVRELSAYYLAGNRPVAARPGPSTLLRS